MAQTGNDGEGHGLLLGWFEVITAALLKLSLGRKLERKRADSLDIYVVSWFCFEVVLLIVLVLITPSTPVKITITALFAYRLFEIAVTTFHSVIIQPIEHRKHRSVPRVFSLVLIHYFEMILIFTVILNFLIEPDSVLRSLQNSVYLAALNAPVFSQENNAVLTVSIVEMLFGIFFIAGVIGILTNYLGSKE